MGFDSSFQTYFQVARNTSFYGSLHRIPSTLQQARSDITLIYMTWRTVNSLSLSSGCWTYQIFSKNCRTKKTTPSTTCYNNKKTKQLALYTIYVSSSSFTCFSVPNSSNWKPNQSQTHPKPKVHHPQNHPQPSRS